MRKTVEVRDRVLGEMDPRTLTTAHLLPILLNKTKMYKEAVNYSIKVLRKERRVNKPNIVTQMETEGELAIALYKLGDEEGSNQRTQKILKVVT